MQFRRSTKRFIAFASTIAVIAIGALSLATGPMSLGAAETGKDFAKAPAHPTSDGRKIAIVAGGCFWCVESDFDKVPGVLETISGYTGGDTENPTYKQVSNETTGHYEALKIVYDPNKVTYDELLYTFWRTVDPTDKGGQFCDRGDSYRTAIFAVDQAQLDSARKSKKKEQTSGKLKGRIVTPVIKASEFYKAEEYHQNYYKKSPLRYKYYRYSCGRDKRIKSLWGDEAHAGLKE